jgi:hypothetical protein
MHLVAKLGSWDIDNDGWYDAGEGLSDVSVQITGIDNPSFKDTVTVGEAGGYQELLDPGKYQVDFSRNGQIISSQIATIDAKITNNVKLDLVLPLQNLNANPPVNTLQADLVLPVVNLQSTTTDAHLLDLRTDASQAGTAADLSNKTIALKFTNITSDASYHNYAGFYQVENEQGTVIDPSNSKSYQPGDNGYLAAALRRSQVTNEGLELDKNGLTGTANLEGGHIYAPFLIANGRVNDILNRPDANAANNVYFHYQAANVDKAEHVRMLGANKFGFEDLFGGGDRDYNDLTFQVTTKVL